MKAIILAAGVGQRMWPMTRTTHKTLLRVGERTIIERIVDTLLEHQITDLVVVTGYLADEVTAFLSASYPNLDITFVHNERFAETNNIFSLALAFEGVPIDDDVLLIECDLVFEPAVLTQLLASPHPNVALVDRYHSSMDGTVVEVSEGIVRRIIPPHLQDADFNFSDKYKTINMYRFSQEFCQTHLKKYLSSHAREINDNHYYELVLGTVIYLQQEVIHAQVLSGEKWTEIDDPNDLEVAGYLFDPATRGQRLARSCGGYWHYDMLDYCYLRNMYFPTSAMLAELRELLPQLLFNYGSAQHILNDKLSYFLQCNPEYLMTLNGGSQAYPVLQIFFQDKKVLIPKPSYGEYSRIFPHSDFYSDDVGICPEEVSAQACHHDLIVFVNPNNPTGSTLPTSWIYAFAAAHPDKIVILDESFIEFSDQRSILPMLETDPLPNVILLKSLTKTLGVPGLRLGYLYSHHSAFMNFVRQAIPIWNLNAPAEYFLGMILKHRKAIQNSYQQTILDREAFASQLESIPQVEKVYHSGGNFLLMSLNLAQSACRTLVETMLLQHHIYVKDVSRRFRNQKSYLRLAVRLPAENTKFVRYFRQIMTQIDGDNR